jgi:protein-L-isoaspartate(D-aspartate) O-methyltransferase
MNLFDYGSSSPFSWTNRHLVGYLTDPKHGLLQDPQIINAFRQVDRADFMPEELRSESYHDRLLKVGYGQIATNPSLIAKKLQLLQPKFGGKYLHLGTGTGYLATLLGHIAGDEGAVYSLERLQMMWDLARENSKSYRQRDMNLEILYRNGRAGLPQKAPYNGIIVSYVPNEFPQDLVEQLDLGGKLIFPTVGHELQVIEKTGDDAFVQEIIPGINAYAYGNFKDGVA